MSIGQLIDKVTRYRKEVLFKRIPVMVANTETQVIVSKNDYFSGYSVHFFTPMGEQEYLDWKPF